MSLRVVEFAAAAAAALPLAASRLPADLLLSTSRVLLLHLAIFHGTYCSVSAVALQ